ncbi:MAG: GH92 family glycosyl hydrolase [Alistipes sp.]|nr:GH92 family glycosyl hydrolase [Alistipes sp.]
MRTTKLLTLLLALATMVGCAADGGEQFADPIAKVNPKIGSGGHGHVFVGANVPFGMTQVGPTSITQEWDWCSGYHDSENSVIGFSHTHLSGTGCGDLFDVTLMPVTGEVEYGRGRLGDYSTGFWSEADRSKEVVKPGYYSVPLTRYNITAEMTATERGGVHRYTFPASDQAAIILDLVHGGCWDRPEDLFAEAVSDTRIVGRRHTYGWANAQKVFFVIEFSKPFDKFETIGEDNFYYRIHFRTEEGEQIGVKVALSTVSVEGAANNFEAELRDKEFDAVAQEAEAKWRKELSKIRIWGADAEQEEIFYTGMYHMYVAPSLFSDVDRKYRGADNQVYDDPGFDSYTTFSLWDTYRTKLPLMTITHPEIMDDVTNTMIDICEKQGFLPIWHLWGCETGCMVGSPGIIAVSDAVAKGIEGIDPERAWKAIYTSYMHDIRGGRYRKQYGYMPNDLQGESIAHDMEFAIADAAAHEVAVKLGKTEEAEYLENRSHSWLNYFDKSVGYPRGKSSTGEWREDFNPYNASRINNEYCEGNAWQYLWLVPQDLDLLVECFGGVEETIEKLDGLFTADSKLEGEDVTPDISGLIGQYVHGNEPSHHIVYFYTMLGQPWKAADRIYEICKTMYSTNVDGLSGNEDVGQMSAWYIMTTLGFYPVEPAAGRYVIGVPLVDKAEIDVEGGVFCVKREGYSEECRYVQRVELNGKALDRNYITHDEVVAGGELRFVMGEEQSCWY